MGQVAAEALQSKAAGSDALDALITDANTNSDLCTFTAGTAVGAGSVYNLTATGKNGSDLAGKYNGAFCVDYVTGKKEVVTNNEATAPTAPDCA